MPQDAVYVLVHGVGDVGGYRHQVEREPRTRGRGVVVMDLSVGDAQSCDGYVAPIACDRVPARLMVLLTAMIPLSAALRVLRETAEVMAFQRRPWRDFGREVC